MEMERGRKGESEGKGGRERELFRERVGERERNEKMYISSEAND